MDISIVAVGRLRLGPEKTLIDTYLKRLAWPVTITEVEERRPIKGPERMRAEAELILKALPQDALVIALDERGQLLDSPEFAEKIRHWQDNGQSRIAFVIGGADGLTAEIRDRAQLLLSFGRMTWPHMMVRAMLSEQIYRAASILANHPYHK
jgi:23S rRNA (pseudouridine1915-N3)-methyltransferase